ncbi:hypothetical protein EBU99_02335 [bacterium]|nr:hypothetical protein [bacterium]
MSRFVNTRNPCFLLGLLVSAVGCAPNQYQATKDIGADVKTRAAGFDAAPGRLNIDCFTQTADASKANDGQALKAIGIPSNCPLTGQSSKEEPGKFDIAVVIDASENFIDKEKAAKAQLLALLNKLNSEQKISALSGVSFRDKIVGSERKLEVAKAISLITGDSADWSPNALKTISNNNTDWVSNDAAKAIFEGIEEGLKHLEAGSSANKMLLILSGSTGKTSQGFQIGPIAQTLAASSSKIAAAGGQLVVNYAASEELARGLPVSAPNPLEQLDQVSSVAALRPVRAQLGKDLNDWLVQTVSRSQITAQNTEACLITSIEALDAEGKLIFKKDVKIRDKNGYFEATLPPAVASRSLTLKVNRSCDKSGATSQAISINLAKGSLGK